MRGCPHSGGGNAHPGGKLSTESVDKPFVHSAVGGRGHQKSMNFLKGVGTSRRPPLAHLWHTSGTPLAHPWSTPGGSPRLPPEKNTKFLTEEQGHEEGGEEKGKKKAAHWSFGIGRLINECAAQSRAWAPERTTTYHSQGETPITHPGGKDHSH